MTTRLEIRLPESEMEVLEAYCTAAGRTKTDVIREVIRGLKKKVQKTSE